MKAPPVIFVPTWVASSIRSNNLPANKLIDANTLSQILNDEDMVDYAKFNSFDFIKMLISSTPLDHSVMVFNSSVYFLYLEQLKQLSRDDTRLGRSKTLGEEYRTTYDFLDLALIYGALDKNLFLRKLPSNTPGSRALNQTYIDLAKRSGVKTYQKINSSLTQMGSLDLSTITNKPIDLLNIKNADDLQAKKTFEQNMFRVAKVNSMVVVYIGEDYIKYINRDPDVLKAYDLASVMPEDCNATTVQRFLLLSILQTMMTMRGDNDTTIYTESYLYKFYISTTQPHLVKGL
jgi:hypothetical protein